MTMIVITISVTIIIPIIIITIIIIISSSSSSSSSRVQATGFKRVEFWATANLRTKNLEIRGFDSNIFWVLRGGIPRPIGNFSECCI